MGTIEYNFQSCEKGKKKEEFNHAIPLGNSHIGLMVYGNVSKEDLPLNENTFWLGNKKRKSFDNSFYSNYKIVQNYILNNEYTSAETKARSLFPSPRTPAIYTTAGVLSVNYNCDLKPENYKRVLNLEEGLVEVSYDILDNHIKRTYISSFKKDVIAIKIESKKDIHVSLTLDRDKLVDEIVSKDKYIKMNYKYNRNDKFECLVYANTNKKTISDSRNIELFGTNIIIYVSMATKMFSKNPTKYVKKRIDEVVNFGFDNLKKESILDYQSLYLKQSFECDNKDIENFYNFSRYLMISSSRMNLPANLQGLWNIDYFPSWDSKYTININLEMNYFNVFGSNLEECVKPYLDLLKRVNRSGKITARKMYHAKGSVAHHNTDIYADTQMVDKYMPATLWPFGLVFMSLIIYEYYEYSLDINILKRYSYIMYDAADFILDLLVKDRDGYYVIAPTVSPENSYLYNGKKYNLAKGCTMDDEMIYELFNDILKINKLFNITNNEKYLNILNNLRPLTISKNGTLEEYHGDFEEVELGHRHISHLFNIFPSIYPANNEIKEACYKSLLRRLENGGGYTGWSKAYITVLFAKFHDSKNAFKSFNEWLLNSTSDTMLDMHPPFQIDGNFGISKAIYEMFISSTVDELCVCPALDQSIKNFNLKGFRIKGNLEIDLFKNSNEFNLAIYSNSNRKYKITLNSLDEIVNLKIGINKFDLNNLFFEK